jgi:phosphate starvation-inducible PhoH-like protein
LEKSLVLEAHKAIDIFGVQERNLQFLREYFPKLSLVSRGELLKIIGDQEEILRFEEKFQLLEWHYEQFGKIEQKDLQKIMDAATSSQYHAENKLSDDVLLHGRNGQLIKVRTLNQKKLVESYEKNDLIFAIGPAGSGKTYTAIALAVRAFKNKEVRKIILSRPAVEAGEKLGFLPGDTKDKLDPYLQPLYDALQDMIPAAKLREHLENNVIQIAPLAFMRGRTLSDAVIILDEAQNTTTHQIKMFLTRLGLNAKMIVTGDITQIDLPPAQKSGLIQAMHILKDVRGIGKVEFNKQDIVRHKLVQQIVEAYEQFDEKEKIRKEQARETLKKEEK